MMRKIIIGVLLNALALYGVIYFLPDEIRYTGGIPFFIIGGLVMGVLNTFVKPVLKLLSLPIQIITIGLSLMVLNGIIFWIFHEVIDTLAIDMITLTVARKKSYFLAGVLFGIINWIEHLIIHNK
ncbi:phage holin family protein [Candidatus Gracilibacteria bacterium]|nr:phage holin family protein [Candidatus Gracilibacteria bacterium]